MTRKDLMANYGRIGLAIAAFALVASIIAAPVLQKLGPSPVVASKQRDEPTFRSLVTPASQKTN
jgi:anti-sigma-K factor RskA